MFTLKDIVFGDRKNGIRKWFEQTKTWFNVQ